jgi:hypothetical protein
MGANFSSLSDADDAWLHVSQSDLLNDAFLINKARDLPSAGGDDDLGGHGGGSDAMSTASFQILRALHEILGDTSDASMVKSSPLVSDVCACAAAWWRLRRCRRPRPSWG